MDYLTYQLLDDKNATHLANRLLQEESNWQDGKHSAGSHAAKVKKNVQLDKSSKTAQESSQFIRDEISKNSLLKSFCLPKKIHGVMFSRTSNGGGYGAHVDNAYMSSGRSDLSFTLFLTSPNEYAGGELSIQTTQEEKDFKLPKGQIVIYPSTSLHLVKTVTQGNRLACVGWITSYIASNEDRSIMFGLDAGARGMLAKYGQSDELDLIFQSYNNLLRRLGD